MKLGQLVKGGFAWKHGGGWGDLAPERLSALLAIVEMYGYINAEHYHDYLIKKDYYERFGTTDVITIPQPVITPEQEDNLKKEQDRLAKFYGNVNRKKPS